MVNKKKAREVSSTQTGRKPVGHIRKTLRVDFRLRLNCHVPQREPHENAAQCRIDIIAHRLLHRSLICNWIMQTFMNFCELRIFLISLLLMKKSQQKRKSTCRLRKTLIIDLISYSTPRLGCIRLRCGSGTQPSKSNWWQRTNLPDGSARWDADSISAELSLG